MRFGEIGRAGLTAAALFTAQQACAQSAHILGPAPLVQGGASVEPVGDPARWISDADYPAAAKAARQSGTVGFVLTVDPDGTVSDCTVMQSSGSKLLDSTTCRLISRRARFLGARDSNNEPNSARWENSVSWTLPPDTGAPPG
jgi:protein TonB